MRSAVSYSILALGFMLLVAASGSDEVSWEREQGLEPLEAAPAKFLVQEVLFPLRTRDSETREYIHLPEEIDLLEQVIKNGPGGLELVEVLSLVYKTHPAYVDDADSHNIRSWSALQNFSKYADIAIDCLLNKPRDFDVVDNDIPGHLLSVGAWPLYLIGLGGAEDGRHLGYCPFIRINNPPFLRYGDPPESLNDYVALLPLKESR